MNNNFGEKIKRVLQDNGYFYRVRVYPQQEKIMKNGKKISQNYTKVIIYSGRNIEKLSQRRSKRLVAWKNPKGEWEGDLEAVKEYGNDRGGNQIYLLDYHDTTEPQKTTLFSDIWEEDEKEFGGQEKKLLKIMENWKFQEEKRKEIEENEKS